MINITKFSNNQMDVNTYVLAKDNLALVIDPGFNGDSIVEHCQKHNLKIDTIILTHGHYDHIRDLSRFIDGEVKIYIHQDELDFLYKPALNLSSSFGKNFSLNKNIKISTVKDQSIISFTDLEFKVLHLPGHSQGSIGISYNQHFFAGDTLFYDSVGRTDLPTGSRVNLFKSLSKLKASLSRGTIIYPGHGKGGKFSDILQKNRYLL